MSKLTLDEAFTAVILELGPLPFPEHPNYDTWYGGGFGTDMLSRETQAEHAANMQYLGRAEILLRTRYGHSGARTLELFDKLVRRPRI